GHPETVVAKAIHERGYGFGLTQRSCEVTARSVGSRRSRQRERRSRSQGNTERFAIVREQRQRLAAFYGRATGGVSGSSEHRPLHERRHQHGVAPIKQRRTAEGARSRSSGSACHLKKSKKEGRSSVVGATSNL